VLLLALAPFAATAASAPPEAAAPESAARAARPFFIQEYRVEGVQAVGRAEIEDAVYPFLGPGRTVDDVERARAAVEKVYRDRGYQTVVVQIPEQTAAGGVVRLAVTEGKVRRLRVRGARYFSPARIKAGAPSLAEGRVPDFNAIPADMVALNQLADRRVTPSLRPAPTPGDVDIDLEVKDSLPLHGSLELNNRRSAQTTALRLNGALSYGNLWQRGHTLAFNFQIAPERRDDAEVYSASYSARVPTVDWLTLTLRGTKQNSNLSTLGGSAVNVVSPGTTAGLHADIALPGADGFYQSLSLGLDYKRSEENVTIAQTLTHTPLTYYPVTAFYTAVVAGKRSETDFTAGVTLSLRGVGSNSADFARKRYGADADFLTFRADLSHTHELPAGFQVFGRVQGQLANEPLVNSEQLSGGGLDTVRGYFESEVLADDGVFGSLELRSPSLLAWFGEKTGEWRVYVFGDLGGMTVIRAQPEQDARFTLSSLGFGSRIRLRDHFTGSVDAAFPLDAQAHTREPNLHLTFRAGADF